MKSKIVSVAGLVAGCSLCAGVGFRAGAQRREKTPTEIVKELPTRVHFNLMGALGELRSGRIENGTRKVETVFFASAAIIYGDPNSREVRLMRLLKSDLIQYRATYCTNSAKWTTEEKQLEATLAGQR
jgi:hypothetical protein